MQTARLQCLKLQVAVAFPDPQTRTFPGTQVSRKTRSPKSYPEASESCWWLLRAPADKADRTASEWPGSQAARLAACARRVEKTFGRFSREQHFLTLHDIFMVCAV